MDRAATTVTHANRIRRIQSEEMWFAYWSNHPHLSRWHATTFARHNNDDELLSHVSGLPNFAAASSNIAFLLLDGERQANGSAAADPLATGQGHDDDDAEEDWSLLTAADDNNASQAVLEAARHRKQQREARAMELTALSEEYLVLWLRCPSSEVTTDPIVASSFWKETVMADCYPVHFAVHHNVPAVVESRGSVSSGTDTTTLLVGGGLAEAASDHPNRTHHHHHSSWCKVQFASVEHQTRAVSVVTQMLLRCGSKWKLVTHAYRDWGMKPGTSAAAALTSSESPSGALVIERLPIRSPLSLLPLVAAGTSAGSSSSLPRYAASLSRKFTIGNELILMGTVLRLMHKTATSWMDMILQLFSIFGPCELRSYENQKDVTDPFVGLSTVDRVRVRFTRRGEGSVPSDAVEEWLRGSTSRSKPASSSSSGEETTRNDKRPRGQLLPAATEDAAFAWVALQKYLIVDWGCVLCFSVNEQNVVIPPSATQIGHFRDVIREPSKYGV